MTVQWPFRKHWLNDYTWLRTAQSSFCEYGDGSSCKLLTNLWVTSSFCEYGDGTSGKLLTNLCVTSSWCMYGDEISGKLLTNLWVTSSFCEYGDGTSGKLLIILWVTSLTKTTLVSVNRCPIILQLQHAAVVFHPFGFGLDNDTWRVGKIKVCVCVWAFLGCALTAVLSRVKAVLQVVERGPRCYKILRIPRMRTAMSSILSALQRECSKNNTQTKKLKVLKSFDSEDLN